jgi:hypothetical protein
MRLDSSDKRIERAIDDAVAWLRRAQLSGIRVQRVSAPETTYEFHTNDFDVVVLSDLHAKPIWARHYEIDTDRPVFAGRDAVKRYALSEIERERRTGTPWYGSWPRDLLERDFPVWRKKLPNSREKPSGSAHVVQVVGAKTLNKLLLLDRSATHNYEKGCGPGYPQKCVGGDQCIGDDCYGKGQVKGVPHPAIGTFGNQSGIAASDHRVGQIVAQSPECPDDEPARCGGKADSGPSQPVW